MNILDGKALSQTILSKLKKEIVENNLRPKLVIVQVGTDPASLIYIQQKQKAAISIGVDTKIVSVDSSVAQKELEQLIDKLNKDKNIQGIIVQKPLPPQINSDQIDVLVDPTKDVDGLNPNSTFIPATARGILELLDYYEVQIKGKKVVVVGTSKLVGRPTGLQLKKKGALVTFCDDKTSDLASKTKEADILVVAVGKQKLITGQMVKKGAIVIDVGINRVQNQESRIKNLKSKIVGDVDFDSVSKIASYITPVPGGVGPMTVAALMQNLVDAAKKNS